KEARTEHRHPADPVDPDAKRICCLGILAGSPEPHAEPCFVENHPHYCNKNECQIDSCVLIENETEKSVPFEKAGAFGEEFSERERNFLVQRERNSHCCVVEKLPAHEECEAGPEEVQPDARNYLVGPEHNARQSVKRRQHEPGKSAGEKANPGIT